MTYQLSKKLSLDEITEILCDGGSDPLCFKNNDGKLPIDLVKSHRMYQLLKLTADRQQSIQELEKLRIEYQETIASKKSGQSTVIVQSKEEQDLEEVQNT